MTGDLVGKAMSGQYDGGNLLDKLTEAVTANASAGSQASTVVARQVWSKRPKKWMSLFDKWTGRSHFPLANYLGPFIRGTTYVTFDL